MLRLYIWRLRMSRSLANLMRHIHVMERPAPDPNLFVQLCCKQFKVLRGRYRRSVCTDVSQILIQAVFLQKNVELPSDVKKSN